MGKRAHNFIDLTDQKFNRLYVLELAFVKKQMTYWLCKCDCGNETTVYTGNLRNGTTKSCGCLKKEMASGIRSGAKHSEETKRKISESRKGKCVGKDSPFYGKHRSEESRRKMSASHKGKQCGKDNPNYKHGLSDTKEYKSDANAKRRASKLNQTPDNANLATIQLYYTICAYLNEPCEKPMWHVDHFQPVSKGGLHHEDNLQILTAKLNFEKYNKWPLTKEEKVKYKGVRI